MNKDKLIKTLLEHEENLDLDDLKNLSNTLNNIDFLSKFDLMVKELDWERGGVLSKCFSGKGILHVRDDEFFMGGNSLRDSNYKTIRVINYNGELPSYLVKHNDRSLDIRASEVDLERCRDYIQSITVRGSKVESTTTNKTGLWMVDSKSDVKIVSRSDHPPMQTVLIKVMGDNSSILFGSTVKRKEAKCVNIEIFGSNNKIGIDLSNFGERSRVELRALKSAEGNKIMIRGVRRDSIYAENEVDYEIR